MVLTYKKTLVAVILAGIFFIILDRFLKILSMFYFSHDYLTMINGILTFRFVKNYQIAFSLPFSGIFLKIFILLIVVVLVILWLNNLIKKRPRAILPLTFLLFGAISNFVDRLFYGYVIDYFDLKYFTVFNLADCMVLGGVSIIIIGLIKRDNL